jgi:hypothetical protein
MNAELEPKLAPPGAGLPKVELFIARAIFAWRGRKATRDGVNERFQKEREAIRSLARSIDVDAAGRTYAEPIQQRVVLKYGKDGGAEGVRTPDLLNAIQEGIARQPPANEATERWWRNVSRPF